LHKKLLVLLHQNVDNIVQDNIIWFCKFPTRSPNSNYSLTSMCMVSLYREDVYQWKSDNPITGNVSTIIVSLFCLSDWQTHSLWMPLSTPASLCRILDIFIVCPITNLQINWNNCLIDNKMKEIHSKVHKILKMILLQETPQCDETRLSKI